MKLYPTELKWKTHPIWIEAEDESAAKGLEYYSGIQNPMLSPNKTDNEPIDLKAKTDG